MIRNEYLIKLPVYPVQFTSVAQSCLTLCAPWTAAHQASSLSPTPGACSNSYPSSWFIQPSHPLSSPFPPAFNLSQHQCLF